MSARASDDGLDLRTWRAAVRRHAEASGVELATPVVDELAQHLDELFAAARRAGASVEEARRRADAALAESALTGLGRRGRRDPRRARSSYSDALAGRGKPEERRRRTFAVWSALRLAVRQLRQHPRLALTTILVLGLGTGAATTVFTVVDAMILRPLPYHQPDRLVTIWDRNPAREVTHDPVSPVNFVDYRGLPVFADAAAWWRPAVNLLDAGLEPMRVNTIQASANLFSVLGVRPQLGAGWSGADRLWVDGDEVAVISDRLWRTRYHADRKVLGRQLQLDGEAFTVVGVMPPGFRFPDDIDVWQRLDWDLAKHSRHAHFMEAVARLAPGVTLQQAQSACDALAGRLATQFAASNRDWSERLIPLLDEQLGYYRPALIVLLGAVGLLLLMAVLSVASLLLARALSREREMGVRIAVGAAARQLVTQLMAESLVLSLGGALLAIGVAAVLLPLVRAMAPQGIPRLDQAALDWPALGACLAVTAGSALVFGLVPALLLLRRQVASDLRSGDRGSSRTARRIYSVLVAAELAVACALLVCSTLLVRTVERMTRTPVGVRGEQVLLAPLQVTRGPSQDDASLRESWVRVGDTHHRILEAVRRQPGVLAAGLTIRLPLEVGWRNPFDVEGQPRSARAEDAPEAQMHSISDGYFEAMGARVVAGRAFSAGDTAERPAVVMVNASFARRYLPRERPVGSFLRLYTSGIGPLGRNLKWTPSSAKEHGVLYEVVGVVGDVRDAPLGQPVEPAIYLTTRQFPFGELTIAVEASSPRTALDALRAAVHATAPEVPIGEARTWGERLREHTAEPRLLMSTLLFFGALAGLLAAIGVYGLFSWSFGLRVRELAIRLTLGALPASVGSLVLRQGAALVGVGLLGGLLLVQLGGAALERVLYGMSPRDLGATVTAVAILAGAAALACALPARRAMRLDPVSGLRAE